MVEKNKGTLDKVFKEKNISNLQGPRSPQKASDQLLEYSSVCR